MTGWRKRFRAVGGRRLWVRALLVALTLAGAAALLSTVALLVAVAREPLPPGLRQDAPAPSLRVLDRHGVLLLEVTQRGEHVAAVRLDDLPPRVIEALLAAEDQRFFLHPGVDPVAMLRALGQALVNRRVVSGASTITQQLARSQFARPKTWRGKLHEIVVALRIERDLDKRQILEAYLNRVQFGPRRTGIQSASLGLFDKPASALGLAEAALLVGLPRGPSLYDPTRGTVLAKRRRDRILERLRNAGAFPDSDIDRALAEPVQLQTNYRSGGAEHLGRALAAGQLVPAFPRGTLGSARTTIDAQLQHEVEALTRSAVARLTGKDVSAAAVVVVDNRTAEVLAYVGSRDFWASDDLGQNDGARALRQPGSALKPFIYAQALQRRSFDLASLLPDIELHLPTARGDYAPRNYDGGFHGPVRLRTALASSLNIPAVYVTERVGPDRMLQALRSFGFTSLKQDAEEYGAALALGDGEVRLVDLAAAYAALGNGGMRRDLAYVLEARDARGQSLALPEPRENRAISADVATLLSDALADPQERQGGFGRGSVLELPFPVAVKTGTSKGYRDNWSIGFSRAVTVAVWVGNFDGRPMQGSSGVTGAGPLFHDVMLAAMRGRSETEGGPLGVAAEGASAGLSSREICALSGQIPGPACKDRRHEHFLPGTEPHEICAFHELVEIVPSSGLRAGPNCPGAQERAFERYPEPFAGWSVSARRPTAPQVFDPRCPGTLAVDSAPPRVLYPFDGAHFTLDAALSPAQQRLVFRTAPGPGVRFVLDGRRLSATDNGQASWPLQPGRHVVAAESEKGMGPVVHFEVEPGAAP